MTEYVQRTSNKEGYENPVMLSFRTSLADRFYDLVGKEMKNVGAHYFAHQLIKNIFKEGHTVSSFMTHPDWQEKYWKDYWDNDPTITSRYTIAKINGCSVVSWKMVGSDSDCMEDRKTTCKIQDGFFFWMQHDNGVMENFSIGWEKYNVNKINRQKLAKLCNMISDFRIQHYRLNSDMFNGAYPAVDFVSER